MCKPPRRVPEADPLRLSLQLVGDPWSLLVVQAIAAPRRFVEVQQEVPGIASNVLAARLRRLVAAGIAQHGSSPAEPGTRRYVLTRRGAGLLVAAEALRDWGARQSPATRYALATGK